MFEILQAIVELKVKCWNNISASHLKVRVLREGRVCLVPDDFNNLLINIFINCKTNNNCLSYYYRLRNILLQGMHAIQSWRLIQIMLKLYFEKERCVT